MFLILSKLGLIAWVCLFIGLGLIKLEILGDNGKENSPVGPLAMIGILVSIIGLIILL